MDGNAYANLRAFAQPQEIDMDGKILDRVELKVARDDAVLGAVDIELVDGGEKTTRVNALLEPGTRPARRSARAAPLPACWRAVAFICWVVAISNPCTKSSAAGGRGKERACECCRARGAYNEHACEIQGTRGWATKSKIRFVPDIYGRLPVPILVSSAAMRAFKASFSSRAIRAISLTTSNSSRLTTSSSRSMRSA